MRLRYSSRALAQLASVHDYFGARNPAAARNVTRRIQQSIARLMSLPRLGKLTDEPDVRVLIEPEYVYRVFYRVDGSVVTVIRILHGSQQ